MFAGQENRIKMFTERFLKGRSRVELTTQERARIDQAVIDVRDVGARTTLVRAGEPIKQSTLLLEGFMSRYIDDARGLRQLVAVQVPGDFVDLHGFPLRVLEHDVATITAVKIAIVPHTQLELICDEMPDLARKLWFSTLLDAAIHRAWLFRLGRLDATGRVAHFLCETNARLKSVGLSDGHSFGLGITQADLAEICGLTSIHVNRVMRQLREDDLCSFRSSRVEIIDPDGLARRGQFDPAYLYLDESSHATRPEVMRFEL